MLGAILGDIVGSPYEFNQGEKTTEFPLLIDYSNYTDDSLMTLAVGQALLDADGDKDVAPELLVKSMRKIAYDFPTKRGGYGGRFIRWLLSRDPQPYGSFGNGSAMRCSAAGWLYPTLEETIDWAEITAAVTHNHPEGIKGAQATAAMIFLARTEGAGEEVKAKHREFITQRFGYDLSRSVDEIRPGYRHVESCQESVPESITCYLESSSYEEAIRLAVSLGGDTDTMAAIAGSIAEAAFGMPADLVETARSYLPEGLLAILDRFDAKVAELQG